MPRHKCWRGIFFHIISTFSVNFLIENLVYIINYFIFALQTRMKQSAQHNFINNYNLSIAMEKTNLTETQSLELITSMINDTRNRLARNSGTPFLIWGYTMIAMLVIEIILQILLDGNWQYFNLTSIPLFLTPIFAFIATKVIRKDNIATANNSKSVKTLWSVIGIVAFIVMLITAHYFTFALLLTMGVLSTGLMMKERSTTICGIVGLVASSMIPIYNFVIKPRFAQMSGWDVKREFGPFTITPATLNIINQEIMMIIIVMILFIVAGHILNHKYNRK